MLQAPFDITELTTALGAQSARTRGIQDGSCLKSLGKANLQLLVQLLSRAAQDHLVAGSEGRDALRSAQKIRTWLEEAAARNLPVRPVLPRLRTEFFQPGDKVVCFIGDSPGLSAGYDWVPGVVRSVQKSNRQEWRNDPGTGGFYWRIEAELEPRVLTIMDFQTLQRCFEEDLYFLAVFTENAVRDWPPIWNIERGFDRTVDVMPYAKWLLRGSRFSGI
jgi:hypothetical protein